MTLPEGRDYATLVLRDPWDMSQYSDISQYLNQSGTVDLVQDVQVQDGTFRAHATARKDAAFFPLFPGYNTAMLIGKAGARYPIDPTAYRCLSVAARVDSGTPDQMAVFWFADERLNLGTWGQTHPDPGIPLSPGWNLYSIDLASVRTYGTRWVDSRRWEGLRIDPTTQNTSFEIDWVRLTDCEPVYLTLSGLPNRQLSFYIRSGGREIFVGNFTPQQGSLRVDVQGVAPGTYTYVLKGGSSPIEGTFRINQTPIADFARPSFTSGADYAARAGNPWDFSDGSDAPIVRGAASQLEAGALNLDTESGPHDAQILLNTPKTIDVPGDYRYLSFRLYTAGSWQQVPYGMIARWIWTAPRAGGRSGECHFVSQDIPFDVGWHTYTVDLADPFNGSPEVTAGDCPSPPPHWTQAPPVSRLRFDPNENITGSTMRQRLDWIRLTQVDRVASGIAFPIQVQFNKPRSSLDSLALYYTTDPQNNPKQHRVVLKGSSAPGGGQHRLNLPSVLRNAAASTTDGTVFLWDTRGVASGEYYICVEADDGYNRAIHCSEAPVQVYAP